MEIIIVIVLIVFVCSKLKNNRSDPQGEPRRHRSENVIQYTPRREADCDPTLKSQTEENAGDEDSVRDYANRYERRYLLTKNEYNEYWKLRKITDGHNLLICPKVRILDLIHPRNGPGYRAALGKMNGKHVDFVITDQQLRVKCIVELDDNSHDRADRINRDNLVDTVLRNCGYIVLRTRGVTDDFLDPILRPEKDVRTEPMHSTTKEPAFEQLHAAREVEHGAVNDPVK